MKFLCVACDQPMTMQGTSDAEDEAFTVLYACPACERQIALVTNPEETQAILNFGTAMAGGEESKCTFLETLQEDFASARPEASPLEPAEPLAWTPEATARLDRVPHFVRGMLKKS
ncbi:MAG: PCP reductase family protein, partial [Nitrospinota bacterium]